MSKGAVLILGAKSDVARALAHRLAADGRAIQFAARGADALSTDQADIRLRHQVEVTLHEFDALATSTHAAFVAGLPELPEIAICLVGLMGEQERNEADVDAAVAVIRSNFEGPASILGEVANRFVERGHGTIVGVSSVAGERGRATNYVYGSAKAGFTAFLSGLRNRLAKRGVHVMTVLPGFMDTAMTADMKLPGALTAQPAEAADRIARAIAKRRDVVYVRPIWRLIMLVIRTIPEGVFKKMKL